MAGRGYGALGFAGTPQDHFTDTLLRKKILLIILRIQNSSLNESQNQLFTTKAKWQPAFSLFTSCQFSAQLTSFPGSLLKDACQYFISLPPARFTNVYPAPCLSATNCHFPLSLDRLRSLVQLASVPSYIQL